MTRFSRLETVGLILGMLVVQLICAELRNHFASAHVVTSTQPNLENGGYVHLMKVAFSMPENVRPHGQFKITITVTNTTTIGTNIEFKMVLNMPGWQEFHTNKLLFLDKKGKPYPMRYSTLLQSVTNANGFLVDLLTQVNFDLQPGASITAFITGSSGIPLPHFAFAAKVFVNSLNGDITEWEVSRNITIDRVKN